MLLYDKVFWSIVIFFLLSIVIIIVFYRRLYKKLGNKYYRERISAIGSFIGGVLGPIALIANIGVIIYLGTHVNEFLTKRTNEYNKEIKINEYRYACYLYWCDIVDPFIHPYFHGGISAVNCELVEKTATQIDAFWGNNSFLFIKSKKDITGELLKYTAETSNSLRKMCFAKQMWDKSKDQKSKDMYSQAFVNFSNKANSVKVILQINIIS